MRNFLKKSGLKFFILVGQICRLRGIPILAYHSVADDNSNISTPCRMFKFQMKYLKKSGYKVISLHNYISRLIDNKPIPHDIVVLTFDDGLKDFYLSAWPVLKELNFSATVFVPTDYIGDTSRWYAKYGLLPVPMLNWDEINELADAGIDIQSHGCSHRPLTTLTLEELKREVRDSKKILEKGLGKTIDKFCCPQGEENQSVATAIKNAGYRMGIGGKNGLLKPHGDPYTVNRQALDYINLNDNRTAELSMEACLKGTFAWYVDFKKGIKKITKN